MKGYSFKLDGKLINFAEDKRHLERQLETMGYTNYKKPGSRDADNWVDQDKIGSSPHWGRYDKYGEVVDVEINETVNKTNSIPDNLLCCELTMLESGTQIYFTDFVTASRIFGHPDKLDFQYLQTHTSEDLAGTDEELAHLKLRSFLYSIRKSEGETVSFKNVIDKEIANRHAHTIRQMHFSDLPEPIKKIFKEFESHNLKTEEVALYKEFNNTK